MTPLLSVEGTEIANDYVTIYDLIKAEADKWGKEAVEAESRLLLRRHRSHRPRLR